MYVDGDLIELKNNKSLIKFLFLTLLYNGPCYKYIIASVELMFLGFSSRIYMGLHDPTKPNVIFVQTDFH